MPDVGVLNLQIRDDSAKAAEGLGRLASSLKRVQQALGSEQRLSSMAGYIKKLNEAVTKAIPEESINRLERLATAVDKISKAGGLNIKGLKGLETATRAAEKIKSTVGDNMADGFEHVDSKVQQTKESIQETVQATKELYKATNQVRQATGHMSQYNPKTGKFEATPFANTREWMEDQQSRTAAAREAYNESRGSSFASARARELADAREKFADSTEKTKKIVANAFGMEVEEMFPKPDALRETSDAMQGVASTVHNVAEAAQESATSIQEVSNTMQETEKRSASFKDRMKEAWSALKGDGEDIGGAKKKLSDMFGSFGKLLDQFGRIAKYRMIRAVLKQITEGFKEGVENYRAYSEQIGGSFAPAMESATSALNQMKNSIGAAAAPVIQELIPYLKMAVSWFVTAINYVNQFFALLRGQSTWSKAIEVSGDAAEDATKKVKRVGGAAREAKEELKDLLADFDELNIIQSESGNDGYGGGGSGGVAAAKAVEETVKMFEEESEFSSFIKDNMNEIATAAKLAGAAILGWRLSNSFANSVGWLSKLMGGLSTVATVMLTVVLADLTGKQYMKTGEPGWLIADAMTGAVGATLAGKLAKKIAGGKAGTITTGVTLILSGMVNVKNAVTMATQSNQGRAWMLNALGAIEIGIGSGLTAAGLGASVAGSLATGFALAGVTFTIGAVLIIDAVRKATYAQMATDAFSETNKNGISTKDYLEALQTKLDELTSGSHLVIDTWIEFDQNSEKFKEGLENLQGVAALVKSDQKLTKQEAEEFKQNWGIVVGAMEDMSRVTGQTLFNGLTEAIRTGSEELKKAAAEARKIAIDLARQTEGIDGAIKKEMEFLMNDIISGKATEEQISRYNTLYGLVAGQEKGQADLIREAVGDQHFDFSQGDGKDAVENAVQFIESLNTEHIQPAIDTVKQQYEAEMGALGEWRRKLLLGYEAGMMNKDEYDKAVAGLDQLASVYKQHLDEQTAAITKESNAAFETVIQQVMDGIKNLDSTSPEVAKAYAEKVMQPIFDAMEKSGYQIPEEAKATLQRMMTGGNLFYEQGVAGESESRVARYTSLANTFDNGEVMALADELDRVSGNVSKISEDVKNDIINAYVEVFTDMPQTFERLSETFGWDIKDILQRLDLSGYAEDELKDLQDTINQLGIDFNVTGGKANIVGKGHFPKNTRAIVAGVPGAGAAGFSNGNTQQVTVSLDDSKQKSNIKDGTNGIQVAINALLDVARAINRKQFTVNITPSTGLGRVNRKSSEAYEKISGDYIGG